MGRQSGDQSRLFYSLNLEERIPAHHLLRRLNPIVTRILAELRAKLKPFYSEIGRPSIEPETNQEPSSPNRRLYQQHRPTADLSIGG